MLANSSANRPTDRASDYNKAHFSSPSRVTTISPFNWCLMVSRASMLFNDNTNGENIPPPHNSRSSGATAAGAPGRRTAAGAHHTNSATAAFSTNAAPAHQHYNSNHSSVGSGERHRNMSNSHHHNHRAGGGGGATGASAGAAGKSSSNGNSIYIGKKMSVISRASIRYTGTLSEIDHERYTLTLSNGIIILHYSFHSHTGAFCKRTHREIY